MRSGGRTVIESEALRVTVDPLVGGTITAVEHKILGASVLGRTPWETEAVPPVNVAAPDERTWLRYYEGGWPVLFPNAGDACEFEGVFHGFHGEASLAPWEAETGANAIRLSRRFTTIPVEMHRQLTVEGELLTIRETVRMLGAKPVRVMWGHHPTFGSDLFDGPFEIQSGARSVVIDDRYDPETNPLKPGAVARWPLVQGKSGSFDLSRPQRPMASLACLQDFESAWVSIRRLDDVVSVALSWDAGIFPCAWLWCELEGTMEAPWCGKARLIGIEPNSTWPANGLADAARRGGRLLTLQPGVEVIATVRLNVFKPQGSILGVDAKGYAILKAEG